MKELVEQYFKAKKEYKRANKEAQDSFYNKGKYRELDNYSYECYKRLDKIEDQIRNTLRDKYYKLDDGRILIIGEWDIEIIQEYIPE